MSFLLSPLSSSPPSSSSHKRSTLLLRHLQILKIFSTCILLSSTSSTSFTNAMEILYDTTTTVSQSSQLINSIQITSSYLEKELIITADLNALDTPSILLLASPPNQTSLPPSISSISQQDLTRYQTDSIYVDRDAYESFAPLQFIRRTPLKSTHLGTWQVGLYSISKSQSNPIRLRMFVLDSKETYCQTLCSSIATSSTCTAKGHSTVCTCNENYTGETCSIEIEVLSTLNIAFQVTAPSFQWKAFSLDLSQYSIEDKFSLLLSGSLENLLLAYVYDGKSTPSFFENAQMINQQPLQGSSSSLSFQQYDITQSNIQEVFLTSKKIIVAFFNKNKQSDSQFQCKLQVIISDSSKVSPELTSKDYFIITGIVFVSALAVCAAPITLLILRSRKRTRLRKEAMLALMRQMSAARLQLQNQDNILEQQPNENNHHHNDDILLNLNASIVAAASGQLQSKKKDPNSISLKTLDEFMPSKTREDLLRLYPSLLSEENQDCMVCLETFTGDIQCRITPCFHVFHSSCLTSWFEKHYTCPYCRAECNRKAIISKIHAKQTTSYLKRMTAAAASSTSSSQHNDEKKKYAQQHEQSQLNQRDEQDQRNHRKKFSRGNYEESESQVNQPISFADIGSKTSLKLTLASRHAHYFGQDTTAAVVQGNQMSPSLDPMRFNANNPQDMENPASSEYVATQSLKALKTSDQRILNASDIIFDRDPISYQSPTFQPVTIHTTNPNIEAKQSQSIHLEPHQQQSLQPHMQEPALSEIPFSSDRKWILTSEAELASPYQLKTNHHLRFDSLSSEIMISSVGLKDRDEEHPRERSQDNLDPQQLQALFPEFKN